MAFFPAPGVAQLVIAGLYGGSETIVSVIHVQRRNDAVFSAWTQPELRNAIMRLSVGWQRFLPQLSSQAKYNEIRGRDLTTELGAVDLFAVPLEGGTDSAPTAPNNAVLIQWRTGKAGRGANGRTFLPGCLEGQVDALGRLVPTYLADMTTRAQGVLTDLNGATTALLPGPPVDLVVLHKAKGVPLARSADPAVTGRCSNVVGTQRRRLPKRA